MQLLHQTVKEVISSGRVGVPVFVRCVVRIESDGECVKSILATVLTMTCSWMEASPLRIYAQSGNKSKHFTVTTHYAGGQTSIVSVNTVPGVRNSLDMMLLGNKGALYHDAETLSLGFDITAEPLPVPEWLMGAVEHSINVGRAVPIEEVSDVE